MKLIAFEYKLLPELAELASQLELQGNYTLSSLQKGSRDFTLSNDIQYHLQLTNTGGAVLLSGTAKAEVSAECDRCLTATTFAVQGEVQGYLVFANSPAAANSTSDLQDFTTGKTEFSLVDKDGSVDLAPFIYAAIIYELPQMVLCDANCLGLCSGCGANLNHSSCDCANSTGQDVGQSEWGDHPFAALKQLL